MARVRLEVPIEPPQQAEVQQRQITIPHMGGKKLVYLVGIVVIAILLGLLINDRNHLKNELKKESSQTQNDTQKYQAEVAQLVEVPTGVTPKVQALTKDALDQLAAKDVAFKNALAGDIVLVYEKADNTRYVVIYRPSTKKVVLATSATLGNTSQSTQP